MTTSSRPGPTPAELAAVRTVLYNRARNQRIADDVASFSTLLNVDAQDPDRLVIWWIPDTGKLNTTVLQAAARCASIAAAHQQMSAEIAGLELNATDKSAIRETLEAIATWWSLRSAAIADPKPSKDPAAVAEGIAAQLLRAYKTGRPVVEYFQQPGA